MLNPGTIFKFGASLPGVGTLHPKHDTQASEFVAEKGDYVGWDKEWPNDVTSGPTMGEGT